MKNLVVVHLESVSKELFDKYSESLSFTRLMEEWGRSYQSFISSATSTAMSMSSFFFGEACPLDHFLGFDSENTVKNDGGHLFKQLRQNGYSCARFIYPLCWIVDQDRISGWGIWNQKIGESRYFSDRHEFNDAIKTFCKPKSPWALYLHPLLAHISYRDDEKQKAINPREYLAKGYQFLDEMVQNLHRHLEISGQTGETIWFFFGDHGDALYTRAFNGGMCHGSEPYLPMVHCPLFLVGNGFVPERRNELITTADCKNLILESLGFETPIKSKLDVVFSQNQFINQLPGLILNKAFMAYDGNYLLMASYLGLEMYDCRMDPDNYNNLLSFFRFKCDGLLEINTNILKKAHPHFHRLFTAEYINEVRNKFVFLKSRLREWVRNKEQAVGAELKTFFPEKYFFKIRSRKYYWRYPAPLSTRIQEWEIYSFQQMFHLTGRAFKFLPKKFQLVIRNYVRPFLKKQPG